MALLNNNNSTIDYFGRVSWGNFLDWLVTLCLGGIIILTTLLLGGVRPETNLALLPLFAVLLTLHGLWLALEKESPKRLSQVPLWFVPGLLWMLCSVFWWSPVPWRGWYEVIHTLQIFIVVWVMLNNVRTRVHLWVLIILSLVPAFVAVFNGFYQFFQDPGRMLDAMTGFNLELHPDVLGRATGAFADANSFAVFLLVLLPTVLIAAAVPRLPMIVRVLSFYIAVMFLVAIAFTQSYWAALLVILVLALVPWFCFQSIKWRLIFSGIGVGVASVVFTAMVLYHPLFKKGLEQATSVDGEGVRMVLWKEALAIGSAHPIIGVGAGAYGAAFEQSPRVALADVPTTPHNDYLLIFSQLGLVGVVLLGLPSLVVFFKAWVRWRKEPYLGILRDVEGRVMPSQRFFLSIGLAGALVFALCLSITFVFYVPALTLYGVLLLSILVKTSFKRSIILPDHAVLRGGYALLAIVAGWSFYVLSSTKLEAQALELQARQQLEHVIDMRIHVSGNEALLDNVIQDYEEAVRADSSNADAWIGLSASVCQLYFRNPANFDAIGARATAAAERAVELSPLYWKTWAQLGVARAFHGNREGAGQALSKALELAPNSSNAHFYQAAYFSNDRERREDALAAVQRALEINPRNAAARRLQQKLLIL